jgi:hypothetical protein
MRKFDYVKFLSCCIAVPIAGLLVWGLVSCLSWYLVIGTGLVLVETYPVWHPFAAPIRAAETQIQAATTAEHRRQQTADCLQMYERNLHGRNP